jgi:hypothetical protein
MSESLTTLAELMYTQRGEAPVSFDQERFGVSYGRTEDGYFVVNTGNAARDAIASVFLNEVGIDNFANSISALKGGEYGTAAKQALYGVTQAALVLIPGVNVARGAFIAARTARVAYGGLGRAFGSRLLQVPRNARYALSRAGQQPTFRSAVSSLVPRFGSTARQLREGRRIGIGPGPGGTWGNIAGRPSGFRAYMDAPTIGQALTAPPVRATAVGGSTPRQLAQAQSLGLVNPAGTNTSALLANANRLPSGLNTATPPAVPAGRLRQMADQRRAVREGIQGTRPFIPAAGTQATGPVPPPIWRQRLNYSVGRSPIPAQAAVFPGTGFAASPVARVGTRGLQVGVGAYAFDIGDRYGENRRSLADIAAAQTASLETETLDRQRAAGVDEQIRAALDEIQPGGAGDRNMEELTSSFNATRGALNFQYDRSVAELRSMYQLAETEDERERLRFILADIQNQHESGQRAIENVFERKREEVSKLTERSRENALKSAQKAFDLYETSAAQLKDMLELERRKTSEDVYGFGAAAPRDDSEYVQLLSAMAPVAMESRQAIGDIGTEGLEWLGAVMGEQSAARGADLQRLSLSTRAAAISQHQRQVDNRVNAERMALAQAVQSLRERQAAEAGALQRASLSASSQEQQMFSPVDVQGIVESAVQQTGSVARAIEQYRVYIAGKPNPLGGVYPQQPPQYVLDAIARTKTQWDAMMQLQEAEMFLERETQAQAAEGLGLALPGAGG